MTDVESNAEAKKALFVDAYSTSHVGNDVLLDSSLELLKRVCPDVVVEVHAQVPESFQETVGIPCDKAMFSDIPQGKGLLNKIVWLTGASVFMFIQCVNVLTIKLPPHSLTLSPLRRGAMKSIANADYVISIGGEMINDSFRKTLPMYMFMFWVASRMGKKVIIFPQSIGPLRRRWTRWLTATVLKKCTVVTPRDEPSLNELHSLGLSGNQALSSPDVGVEQPAESKEEAEKVLSNLKVSIADDMKWLGVTVSSWVEEGVAKKNYLDTLAESLIQLSKKHNIGVLLMPANMPVYGNDTADYEAAEKVGKIISDHMQVYILEKRVYSARLFKAMQGCMDAVISTRMHASILSTMICTPTITINTQRKLYGYMQRIGQQRFSLDIHDLSEKVLLQLMEEILNNQEKIREELKDGYKKVSKELEEFTQIIRPVLDCNK